MLSVGQRVQNLCHAPNRNDATRQIMFMASVTSVHRTTKRMVRFYSKPLQNGNKLY